MRHLLANLAVYMLAAGLVVGAMLFAWIRQEQVVLATEKSLEPREYLTIDDPDNFDWESIGRHTYVANCRNCHGTTGDGRDVYPPVRGQTAVLAAEGGRDYLARVVIYGLASGEHSAPMPPMPHLSDAQIAAANNYMLTYLDDVDRLPPEARLFIPSDVRRMRGKALNERDVAATRPDVPLPRELARDS